MVMSEFEAQIGPLHRGGNGPGHHRAAMTRLWLAALIAVLGAGFGAVPASAQGAPATTDVVFLVDGSGSIDSTDFAIQKVGITTALGNASFFPLDGSVAVSLIQWSSSVRVELPRTVLGSPADRDAAIATVNGIMQIGGGTNPALGINAYSQVLTELGTGSQVLCLSTDGTPSSQSALESAAASAEGAGVERLTVLAIEDAGAFSSANAQASYGPAVFGGGTVVTTRNAAEFGAVVGGACLSAPVELVGLEVNQNVQTWENSVRLVASKPTIVRAHVQSTDGSTTPVVGRLFGERSGAALPGSPLSPINANVDAGPDALAVRGELDKSLNFSLPTSWASGSITLRVELLGAGIACSEVAPPTPNDCAAGVSFEAVSAPNVRLVQVPYTDAAGTEQIPSNATLDEQAERMKSLLPISGLTYDRRILNRDDPFVEDATPANNVGFLGDVNEALLTARSNDGSNALYMGVLQGSVPRGGGGLASGIGSNASSWFVDGTEGRQSPGYARNRGPHEFAHNVGEEHAGDAGGVTLCSGNAANVGVVHPFRDTIGGNEVPLLAPLGDPNTEGWGVDSRFVIDGSNDDLAIIDPNTTFALMGYCRSTDSASQGRWIDTDYHPRLLDAINGIDWSEGPVPDPGRFSWIRGIIGLDDGAVEFKPVLSSSPGVVPTAMPPGGHQIDFLDAAGAVIRSETFAPITFESDVDEPFGNDARTVGIFVVPVRDAPDFASFNLVDPAGAVMATRVASPNPPTIDVTAPAAGEVVSGDTINVTWTSADVDGDQLFHTVQYSSDSGLTWTTLAVDIRGNTTAIPRSAVDGSDTAAVRVIASDGTRSADDRSEFFLVANNAPDVRITSPADGSAFSGVQSVILRTLARDQEDGDLSANVSWSSSIDGALGGGAEVAVVASDLSEGTHVMTASVSDSQGATGSASVSITISRVAPAPGPAPAPSTPVPSPPVPPEYCPGSTTPVDDALPNGGCPDPLPTEFCPGSTTPADDALPNGGCPQPTAVPVPTQPPTPTATPEPVLTPTPVAAPTATAVPASTTTPPTPPTAVPIITDVPPAPSIPPQIQLGGLDLDDPYTCGGGFAGSVSGGLAPYLLSYRINGPLGSFELGTFAVMAAGPYTSPPGFIDYNTVPDGDYNVHITVVDSSSPSLTSAVSPAFSTRITDLCAAPVVAPVPVPVSVPGPVVVTVAVPTSVFKPAASPSVPPKSVFVPATATNAPATTDEGPKVLALTGSTPVPVTQAALALVAIGALIMSARARAPHLQRSRRPMGHGSRRRT